MRERRHVAATVLHYLLTVHLCVVSVEVTLSMCMVHHQLICEDVICVNTWRRCRRVGTFESFRGGHDNERGQNFAARPHLNRLQELECQNMGFSDSTLVEGLAELLESNQSSTTPAIDGFFLHDRDTVVVDED
ncbi:hypothetical protein HPB50_009828 [Hyalomma asiaticum]|uniref:Uncharacterized protein n=1 Tax=Hyalomma asiaticum TaxID=266040 RepID=A0ACB7RTP7_HYAAI|nr:hypothetical protein HPB50_009828 [Hyalomma asiaticum]